MKSAFWAVAGGLALVAASCSSKDRDFTEGSSGSSGRDEAGAGAGAEAGGSARPVGGASGADGGQAGMAEGGSPLSLPENGLGEPCSDNGALGCNGAAQKLSLLCKDGVWTEGALCKSDENCDQTSGVCTPILPECDGKIGGQLYCGEADTVFRCGPDLVSADEVEKCVGKCEPAANACGPFCGDGIRQPEEECDDKNAVSGDGCSKTCTVEPVQLVGLSDRICALGSNGQIRCFKSGATSFEVAAIRLPAGVTATAIAGDNAHLCALLSGGQVRCWGNNEYGQLGLSDAVTRDFSSPSSNAVLGTGVTATNVAVGFGHTCATLNGGNTKCWGRNDDGELGIQMNASNLSIGDQAGEMGDGLPTVASVDGISQSVSAGSGTTCVVTTDKTAHCFGWGTAGIATAAGNVSLGAVSTVKQLAISNGCYCALLTDDTLKCWGGNGAGQLGQDDTKTRNTLAVLGDNLKPVNLGEGKKAKAVYMLGLSTFAILTDGTVKAWGDNSNGILGRGDTVRVGGKVGDMAALVPIALPDGRKAQQLGLSGYTYCALLSDGAITCWGLTPGGVLGDQPNEMGAKLPIVKLAF